MFGAVNMKNSVLLFDRPALLLDHGRDLLLDLLVRDARGGRRRRVAVTPLVAATGVSGQLTGSSGGKASVSSVEPANVVWFWMYCFVPCLLVVLRHVVVGVRVLCRSWPGDP